MHMTFELHVMGVFLDNNAFNEAGLRIPSDVVSNGELFHRSHSFQRTARTTESLWAAVRPIRAAMPGQAAGRRSRRMSAVAGSRNTRGGILVVDS